MSLNIYGLTADLVLSENEYGYAKVLEDFKNADYINIVTYNITSFEDAELIQKIRNVSEKTPINIILNIPNKYKGRTLSKLEKTNASKQTYYYLRTLERSKFGDINVYFHIGNHAKLIMTNNIAYIGSQNFSDASSKNIELGFIIKEPNSVKEINSRIFEGIKKKSVRYSTSDYTVKMEEIAYLMNGLIEDIRYDIFTIRGDEPYLPEIEVFDIEEAYFSKDKWERFKELNINFNSIIDDLNHNYNEVFNGTKANELLHDLRDEIEFFVTELDEFASFMNSKKEAMMWDKFWELDDGEENLNRNIDIAMSHTQEYKKEKFGHLFYKSEKLIQSFDRIKPILSKLIDLIEEIKFEMIRVSVYENEEYLS